MDLNEYQKKAKETAVYGEGIELFREYVSVDAALSFLRLSYCVMKLNGEAGEIAEEVAKAARDIKVEGPDTFLYTVIDGGRAERIIKELGDVLWYAAMIAEEFNVDLNTVAALNIEKLKSRQERGKLHGSGSDR